MDRYRDIALDPLIFTRCILSFGIWLPDTAITWYARFRCGTNKGRSRSREGSWLWSVCYCYGMLTTCRPIMKQLLGFDVRPARCSWLWWESRSATYRRVFETCRRVFSMAMKSLIWKDVWNNGAFTKITYPIFHESYHIHELSLSTSNFLLIDASKVGPSLLLWIWLCAEHALFELTHIFFFVARAALWGR